MKRKVEQRRRAGTPRRAATIGGEAARVAALAEGAAKHAIGRATRATNRVGGLFGGPGEAVAGRVGTALHMGEDALGMVGRLIGSGIHMVGAVDHRLRTVVAEIGPSTRADVRGINKRLDHIEAKIAALAPPKAPRRARAPRAAAR